MLASCSRWSATGTKGASSSIFIERLARWRYSCGKSLQRRATSTSTEGRPKPRSFQKLNTSSAPFGTPSLRSQPWQFSPDHTQQSIDRRPNVDGFNYEMGRMLQFGKEIDVLKLCSEMKMQGIRPNATTYNLILEACAKASVSMEAWAVYEDMRLMRIQPSKLSFLHLINAHKYADSSHMWNIIDEMQSMGITPDAKIFGAIISRYVLADNLEMALQFTSEMNNRGLPPDIETAGELITLAAEKGYPRLAVDLAKAFEEGGTRRLGPEVWIRCLESCTHHLFAEGVQYCWTYVVNDLNVMVDEGMCINVLHSAARHGLPELGADALRILKSIGVILQEYHLAPMVESLCQTGNLKDALEMLSVMRSSGVQPTAGTAEPILKMVSKDTDAVDSAFSTLDESYRDGKPADAFALNIIIRAAVSLGDLQRAVGTYKSFPDFKVAPTVDTFNILLSGCVAAPHRELGDRFISEMKEARIKPNLTTYENIILLCLTQETYEDSFFYLEEMKAAGFKPTLAVYDTLIDRCIKEGDTRYNIAIEEVTEHGYPVSKRWAQYLDDHRGRR